MLKKIKQKVSLNYLKKKFKNKELSAVVLKNLMYLNSLKENEMLIQLFNEKLVLLKACSTFKNICTYSGRTNGYFRMFQMSRFFLKNLASQKMLPGVYKAIF